MTAVDTSRRESFREAALTLIRHASTLTLSTCGEAGPWSAPVYYTYLNERFFFFSSPRSRHIQQAKNTGMAAASLYHQADSWQSIRGVQMIGTVQTVRSVQLSLNVIRSYLERFPFTREFFPENPAPTLDAFFSRFKTRLYVFLPMEVFYTDNRFGFASRQRIEWGPLK